MCLDTLEAFSFESTKFAIISISLEFASLGNSLNRLYDNINASRRSDFIHSLKQFPVHWVKAVRTLSPLWD